MKKSLVALFFVMASMAAAAPELAADDDKAWKCVAEWHQNGTSIKVTEYGSTRVDAVKNVLYRCYKIGVWCHRFHEYRDCRENEG